MIFFITVLRALAACLITNAHYTGVYPTDLIANGGLIGDILFFAVSGYCLYQIREPFVVWYGKRLGRVYPSVWIFTIACLLMGAYSLENYNLMWRLVYPTYYHFIASIVVLYLCYYPIVRIQTLKKHLPLVMGIIGIIYLLVYIFLCDKTYYHIDVVREPMIRFLFLESMLLGAYFRQNDERFRKRYSPVWIVAVILTAALYFVSKIYFSRNTTYLSLQFLNQITIFLLLYTMFRLFAGLDERLLRVPTVLKELIELLASITLEIYIVQYVLIDKIRPFFSFPINWMALTGGILVAAIVLRKCDAMIRAGAKKLYGIMTKS